MGYSLIRNFWLEKALSLLLEQIKELEEIAKNLPEYEDDIEFIISEVEHLYEDILDEEDRMIKERLEEQENTEDKFE